MWPLQTETGLVGLGGFVVLAGMLGQQGVSPANPTDIFYSEIIP